MRHEKKIKRILIRVEFDCYGRIAFADAEIDMELLKSPLALRAHLDSSIEQFLASNPPLKN